MKIIICYPPLSADKGFPTLGQNRQFQYFKEPTCIYPVVPSSAATLLKQSAHQVRWLDCNGENIAYPQFLDILRNEKPDLIAFETKTPVVKQHWKIIDDLAKLSTEDYRLLTVLFGDHVTALPEESFHNSRVDFVLTGGDYDFLLLNLCNALEKTKPAGNKPAVPLDLPVHFEPGIYYRQANAVKNSGPFQLNHDLNSLPYLDRQLTRWQLYAYKNGNYKVTPGTYIMSGRDCWWGKCTFCSWGFFYPRFRCRSVDNVLGEIEHIVSQLKAREIMDDTGSFPAGEWLHKFCRGIVSNGYHKKTYFDCNMRFGALSSEDFKLMKRANFRLLLFGLESANQRTLDRIDKNLKVERIIQDCIAATRAGLFPHITVMFGYPWEEYADALKTFQLASWLLKKGYAYTMQATMVIPYPGTPLFSECRKQGWLKTLDWDDYDMKQPVMKVPYPQEEVMKFIRSLYRVSFNPQFLMRKFLALRDAGDLQYSLRAAKKVVGHILDFRRR